MGEEVGMSDYQTNTTVNGEPGGGGDNEERVLEWEMGLPNADDLTPLSHLLISSELASAFRILPEPYRTLLDVNRASQTTLSKLQGNAFSSSNNTVKSFTTNAATNNDPMVVEEAEQDDEDEDYTPGPDPDLSGPDTRTNKWRRIDSEEEDAAATTLKRPRLVWTPPLHKRFVDVVAHLGIKNAVPKTIMQLMNVEGLTRENVASHLQKYRLYFKRMQGFSSGEGGAAGPAAAAASSSDHQLFASTPMPQSLHESNGNGNVGVPIHTVAYHHHHHHHAGMIGMPVYGNVGMHNHHGNNYGSLVPYPHYNHHHHHHHSHHVVPNDNM